jgi:hypothetical protein
MGPQKGKVKKVQDGFLMKEVQRFDCSFFKLILKVGSKYRLETLNFPWI